ncbi:MAG TPA: carboxypeptidase-like regulatory domain-containing protein [Flavisolibacter sp.]|jgi:hypothetical protein
MLSAQNRVEGVVVDAGTKSPVAGATIYINNTAVSTVTDSKGAFVLQGSFSWSGELVVSHISYAKKRMPLNPKYGNEAVRIELQVQAHEMENITIETKGRETWNKWGELFTSYFIGTSQFAKFCTITNPQVLRFRFDQATQTVTAHSRAPLIIENKALGYKITYDLEKFSYSFQTHLIFYGGTTFFEKVETASLYEKRTFALNRLQAYRGSRLHFMRALYSDSLRENGFSAYLFKARRNDEKARLMKKVVASQSADLGQSQAVYVSAITGDRDSQNYYMSILAQPDYVFYDSIPLNLSVAPVPGTTEKILKMGTDTLLVSFYRLADKDFTDIEKRVQPRYRELPPDQAILYNFFRDYKPSPFQYSLFYLVSGDALSIEPDGIYRKASDLFTDGYMAWKKMAHLLPWDYDPSEDKALMKKK